MNPISVALEEIGFRIPQQLLQQTFITQDLRNCLEMVSLETRIKEAVIDTRVMRDINLLGGTEAFIPLSPPVNAHQTDPYTIVYQIPAEVVQNRNIVQVYSVHFAMIGYQNAGMAMSYTETPLASATRSVLDSAMQTPPAATSYLNLIAPNTVMARFVYAPYPQAFMRVRLGSDASLSHIRPQMYPTFSDLCVLAVKAYIYNKMVIVVDEGQLHGGQMLGTFREIMMNYADSDELYRETLKKWRKQSVLNDPEANRRHIRTIVGRP
jgi:hypothetical protein